MYRGIIAHFSSLTLSWTKGTDSITHVCVWGGGTSEMSISHNKSKNWNQPYILWRYFLSLLRKIWNNVLTEGTKAESGHIIGIGTCRNGTVRNHPQLLGQNLDFRCHEKQNNHHNSLKVGEKRRSAHKGK